MVLLFYFILYVRFYCFGNMLRDSFGAIRINETSEVELRWSCLETELERQVTWFGQRRDRGYTE